MVEARQRSAEQVAEDRVRRDEEDAEENEPRARQLPQRQEVGQRGQDDVADHHHAQDGQRLPRDGNGAVAVVAVIREEQHRPDDQDDRVDLEVLGEREETGREVLRGRDGHHDVTNEEGREKGG